MKITLNGEKVALDSPLNVNALLSTQGYEGKLVAVAVNGHFVARSTYGDHIINDNDDVEIVAPMQGG